MYIVLHIHIVTIIMHTYISMCQALIKGISGGQRKRTSVGVEIITDPDVRNLSLSDVVCYWNKEKLWMIASDMFLMLAASYCSSTSLPLVWTPSPPSTWWRCWRMWRPKTAPSCAPFTSHRQKCFSYSTSTYVSCNKIDFTSKFPTKRI